MCRKESFEQTNFSVLLIFSLPVLHFETLNAESQNFSKRTCGAFLKSAFYLYRGTVLGNKCLKIKPIYILNRLQAEGLRRFVKKNSEGLSCCKQSERNFFVTALKLSIIWYSFRLSSGKLRHFWGTRFLWEFKTAIHKSTGAVKKLSKRNFRLNYKLVPIS